MTCTATPTVLRPGDAGYDAARLGFDARAPHRPAAVVRARDAGDVVLAVRRAIAEDRGILVQATGHGTGATDPEALLVDTSGMRELTIDAGRRVARVGAGVRAGALVAAAAEHGLAPLNGSHPGVGVVGHVLHGGVGLLSRAHGWAADHLRAVELVTAQGDRRRVERATHGSTARAAVDPRRADEDLAWALGGGGGSFGIVTAVEVGLVPLRTVFGGQLVFDASDAPRLLRAWRDWAADAPDALGTAVSVAPVPDVEGPPPALRGRTVVTVHVAVDGSAAEGERLVAPLRALGEPLLDGLGELPWTASGTIHAEPDGPTASVVTNLALRDLPDAALDAALAGVPGGDSPRVLSLRRLGGAMARPGAAGPVRRDAAWLAGVVGVVPPPAVPAGIPAAEAFCAAWTARMAPFAAGRLANFLFGDGADPAAVRAAYAPADWDRLQAVRAAADPDGRLLAGAPVPAQPSR